MCPNERVSLPVEPHGCVAAIVVASALYIVFEDLDLQEHGQFQAEDAELLADRLTNACEEFKDGYSCAQETVVLESHEIELVLRCVDSLCARYTERDDEFEAAVVAKDRVDALVRFINSS